MNSMEDYKAVLDKALRDRDQWRALAEKSADALATLKAVHDERVTDLLLANNREVARRRKAEQELNRVLSSLRGAHG